MGRVFFLVAFLLVAHAPKLGAQAERPWWPGIRENCPAMLTGWSRAWQCTGAVLTDWPAHMVVAPAGPWSGIGVGIGLTDTIANGARRSYEIKAGVIATPNRFLVTDDTLTIIGGPLSRSTGRTQWKLYGQFHHLPELRFFGLGPDSPNNPNIYGMSESIGGVGVASPLDSAITLGGGVELRWPSLAAGSSSALAAAGFSESSVPGLASQPTFVRGYVSVRRHSRLKPVLREGVQLTYSIFQGIQDNRSSFGQLEARAEASLHGIANGDLAFRARITASNSIGDGGVPFYYQPTLGGRDASGSETLRGFSDTRFRAPSAVLAQVDYVHPLFTDVIRIRIFGDVGQVASGLSDIGLRSLRSDEGVGLDLFLSGRSRARLYTTVNGERPWRVAFLLTPGY